MKKTIADLLVESLVQAGVKRIYGIVGDSLNAVLDAIKNSKKIEWIGVRHEEVAAFAAGADAFLSDSIAVCAGSSGPGNLHLINGLYDCHRSRIPVLAIAAHIPSGEIGSDYFQQTRPEQIFKDCSHFCETVTTGEQMPRMVTIAMQHAISRKGVSVLVLPGDVASVRDEEKVPDQVIHVTNPVVRPSESELERLANYLNNGKRITLLCGAGCEGAHSQLMELCSKLNHLWSLHLEEKNFLNTTILIMLD